MKISEMNKILKEMKEIVKFDDKETNIIIKNAENPIFKDSFNKDRVIIYTKIKDVEIQLEKQIEDKKGENEND